MITDFDDVMNENGLFPQTIFALLYRQKIS